MTRDIAELATEAGIRRVHILQWRDLDDVEAGGSEIHSARVAQVWSEAGLEVVSRASYAQGHPPEGVRDGYRVVRRRGRYMVFPASVVAELRGLHGPRDALVEIWNGVPFLSPLWARGPKVTVIHHAHRDMWAMVLEERLARAGQLLESRLAPPFYRRVPIVTDSESSRREIVDYMHFRPEHITVVPPGVDGRFTPDGPKSPHPLVLGVGRLMPPKRFDEMIRIADRVREHVPDLELVIVGDGYERPDLEALVADLGAESWVRLAGRITDAELLALYRSAWVVASASVAEGWGMTLSEAAACGTPAVATRIAGHEDSVNDGNSGLLADTTADFVEKLTAVLTDPDLREQLSEGALKFGSSLTWQATAMGVFLPLAEQAMRRQRRSGGLART